MEKLRKQIDLIDEKLLEVLAERNSVATRIGKYKKTHGLKTLDSKRWAELISSRINKAKKLGLSDELVKKVFSAIHKESLTIQKKLK